MALEQKMNYHAVHHRRPWSKPVVDTNRQARGECWQGRSGATPTGLLPSGKSDGAAMDGKRRLLSDG